MFVPSARTILKTCPQNIFISAISPDIHLQPPSRVDMHLQLSEEPREAGCTRVWACLVPRARPFCADVSVVTQFIKVIKLFITIYFDQKSNFFI